MSKETPRVDAIEVVSTFVRRLIKIPNQNHPQESILKIVAPPPGLEGFATRLQEGIDTHATLLRQREVERKNTEAARLRADAEYKAKEEQRKRDLIEEERLRKENALAEATRVLHKYQVLEKLKYIQQTVWEGKGEIKSVETQFNPNKEKGSDKLGGLELVYSFPSHTSEERGDPPHRIGRLYQWRNMPTTESMQLSVSVFAIRGESEATREIIGVSSDLNQWTVGTKGVTFPIDAEDGQTLLEKALFDDSIYRATSNGLPSQREKFVRERLQKAKKSEGWMEWVRAFEPNDASG